MGEAMSEQAKAASAVVEPGIPEQGITVELAHATVAAFEQAVEAARRHPSFQQFGEGKALRVRVTYQLSELDALQELKDAAWDLHHKRAWLHGAEIAWHQMAQLTHCFRELLRRPRREHCFFDGNFWSGFGCRYAIANLSDRINNEWLTFGRLEAGGAWVFDKARIAEHVRKHLYSGFQHCPAFDEEYLELFFELFPERVDPVEDDRWQLVKNRQGELVGIGPTGVEAAKKIVYELQEKIRQRRGAEKTQENGKRKLPAALFAPYQTTVKKKKGLLARLLG
ncbi:MAG: hypothetical protein A3D93_04965 [Acidobacteria bacterium RIFCSPHIGHO2_12_FULL_67_30]|nr:MAG: hypothetical protein A2620_05640 [Acidobacteria bacterium RIFCSPHIGHO2_01_FULL_67_28]OFV88741.1 MAG: hypothetical protein A3D93_04965 [Acidobacteria bacterium RIFCSPHIGHO2_12_FULL_67_30]